MPVLCFKVYVDLSVRFYIDFVFKHYDWTVLSG